MMMALMFSLQYSATTTISPRTVSLTHDMLLVFQWNLIQNEQDNMASTAGDANILSILNIHRHLVSSHFPQIGSEPINGIEPEN